MTLAHGRPLRVFFSLISAGLLLVFLGGPSLADVASQESEGCEMANDPFVDAQYGGASMGPRQFFAGETISVSANLPSAGPQPTIVRLLVGTSLPPPFVVVDAKPFPSTVTYTFPADGVYFVDWNVDTTDGATWTVSCSAGSLRPGKGCGDADHLHERKAECKKPVR